MATGDKKRAVMTDDIDNAQSSYPVMSLRTVDAAPDAAHTNNLISSAAVAAKASSLAAGMAIIATGNTHAAITKGQYVYIQDHATLAEGMYEATANIAANGTLSTSNVAAKTEGAANALKAALDDVALNAKVYNKDNTFDPDATKLPSGYNAGITIQRATSSTQYPMEYGVLVTFKNMAGRGFQVAIPLQSSYQRIAIRSDNGGTAWTNWCVYNGTLHT